MKIALIGSLIILSLTTTSSVFASSKEFSGRAPPSAKALAKKMETPPNDKKSASLLLYCANIIKERGETESLRFRPINCVKYFR